MKEDMKMADFFKNAILAGIGLASLTREKAEEFAKELINRGELSENDKAKFVKDVMDQTEKSKTELEKKIEKSLEEILAKLNIPTRKEFEELKKKVEELSQTSTKMEE
jgi:poly(hydroxyalkanoate) granule-associated protein